MNDSEHRNYVHEMMTMFRAFKLSKSIFRGNIKVHKATGYMMNIPENEFDYVVTHEMATALAKHIHGEMGYSIKKTDDGEFNAYDWKLLIMRPEDLLTVVEAAIQFMPEEHLNHIRNGS